MKSFKIKSLTVSTIILLWNSFTVKYVNCYSVEINPGQKECFSVAATSGMPCSGSFEILEENPKPITVKVTGPTPHAKNYFESKFSGDGSLTEEQSEGTFSFDAETEGDYSLCISNGNENENDGVVRTVAFNFRTVVTGERDYQYNGLESELDEMKQGLDFLIDHQSFMNQREDNHRNHLESMNRRILFWTIIESVILVALAFWQIVYISNFFETKRRL